MSGRKQKREGRTPHGRRGGWRGRRRAKRRQGERLDKPMPRSLRALRGLVGVVMMLTVSGLLFTGAFYLVGWYFAKEGIQWGELPTQLATWLVCNVMLVLLMTTVGVISRPQQLKFWQELKDVLRRIARGDFNVKIENEERYHGQAGILVQSIKDMAEELKQMEMLRQELISNVSHEIQSPLTSIRGFANALQKEDLSREERRHFLSIIETESARLSKLSDNLLKLTSLESEHQPFEPRPYRLDTQLQNLVLASEPQWLEKGLDLELDLAETTITADEELLSQVWINLLHNAIKFTPPGGSLSISLDMEDEQVRVRVTDTGIGIAPGDQPRIFERFYKGDKSRTRTAGGSGLGLSIVQKIIDLHQGQIRLRSEVGKGSTFEVQLPQDVQAE
ncbi:MAG TPA: HAMP domain-containing sensor histidine kinase [Bacilli bacterium]|nr:HAMP domain-containing sensor histidine kinase [Bacilli bacterium]